MRQRNNGSLPAYARAPGVLPGMLPSEAIDGSSLKDSTIRI
jgi:hypothetical protein